MDCHAVFMKTARNDGGLCENSAKAKFACKGKQKGVLFLHYGKKCVNLGFMSKKFKLKFPRSFFVL